MSAPGWGRGGPWWAATIVVAAAALSPLPLAQALVQAPDGSLATWLPASGLLTAVLVTVRRAWWPLLAAVAYAITCSTHLLAGRDVATCLAYGFVAVAGTLSAAAVIRHRRTPEELSVGTQADLVRLTCAGVVGGFLAGTTAAVAGAVTPSPGPDPLPAMLCIATAHVASVMVLVPALLPHRVPRWRADRLETLAQWALLLATLTLCLTLGGPMAVMTIPLPFLVWGAFRLGLRNAVAQLFLLWSVLSPLSAAGRGPFAESAKTLLDPMVIGTLAQGYVISAALICLPTAVAVAHSRTLDEALRSERELSEMTLATAACLVLVTDTEGTLLRVNPAASRLLGRDARALIGTPAWNLVPREHHHSARRMFSAPDGSRLPSSIEGRLVDHAGEERRLLWTTGVVRDENHRPTHLVLTGLDVTAELNAAGHTEHLLRAPIDTAIVGIDRQGRITLVNSGAEAVLGRPAEALVGTPFIRVLQAAELAEWARGFRVKPDFASLLAQAVDEAPRDWHWLGDGTSTLVSMELSRILDNSGTLIGYLCVANDVTEARTRQQLLVDALDQQKDVVERLRELDATKDHFVTTVSHELRTPVATIVGYTEMLTAGELGDLTPQQVKALRAVNRNGERLVTLVDNLLALAGVSSDALIRERDRVDLVEVAKEAERQTGSLLQGRSLTVIFDFPGAQVPVGGERRQLALVVSNLLSNGIKFTEDGGEVRCVVRREGGLAVLEVRDNGLGIPEEEQVNLFGRFWRSSTAVNRHIQGTGLGLATAQAIVAAHGGSIEIDSKHLGGTTVKVSLPLRPTDDDTRAPRPDRTRRERSTPARPRRPGSPGLPELIRRSGH